MLSRKLSAPGMMSAAAGIDRGRVGERLQAALAGLQELHHLKEKQGDMVTRALRMDRDDPVSAVQTGTVGPETGTEEQRLEATLAALKQQLSHLRRQDVGLKSHLQQLDQQISELKLDVCKASTEQLESDSRPSSGFYELSDGGSCSLSNSCTSVYSECLSSSSQTSLFLPPSSPATSHPLGPPSQADVCRRRSADETAAQPGPPRATGLHLGSSRIRTGTERGRPRPVSTGDLDRMMTLGLSYHKPADVKKPPMCPNLRPSTVDLKFQSNLVSRSGAEVYHYPSPLHAVALHSPIFYLGGEPAPPGPPEGRGPLADSIPSTDTVQRAQVAAESKPLGYMDKLLQSSRGKINIRSEAGKGTPSHTLIDSQRGTSEVGTPSPEVPETKLCPPQPTSAQASNIISADVGRRRRCILYSSQEQVNHRAPGASHRYSYPAATRELCSSDVITSTSSNSAVAPGGSAVRARSERTRTEDPEPRAPERKGQEQKSPVAHSSKREESRDSEVRAGRTAPADFVHAEFVPAGSERVKVRQADRKTKATKLRRRSSEKTSRAWRHQQVCPSSERTRETSGGASREERELRRSGKGRMTHNLTNCPGEERGHSGSDSSLCGPGLLYTQRVHPKPPPIPAATKPSKSRRPQSLDMEHLTEQGKWRQAAARWPSELEMFQTMCVQRSRETFAAGNRQMARSVSVRPHSGHWSGPHPRALQPSLSASSYFKSLNARYPPAPFPASSHYPTRCESEYSAECASLFHSTIAESSEGEMSDNTTNRFGDSESSQSSQSLSDSDSSLSMNEGGRVDSYVEEGGLVWAKAALGPTAAGLPLQQLPRPEPPACRIKASRALKKKICRFQPASLKVMTLV